VTAAGHGRRQAVHAKYRVAVTLPAKRLEVDLKFNTFLNAQS
jgi:hypothetical protein